jgi:hypothetical protein
MTKAVLTTAAKKAITADWAACFPNLGVARPMWLMKRNGPILMGVCLDRTRSNDVYIPVFHVHCLLKPSTALTLELYRSVPDEQQPRLSREIRVDRHAANFHAAVEALKQQTPEITERETTLSRLLALYHDYIDARRDPAVVKYPRNLFADVITLTFWAGHEEYARSVLEEACAAMRSWPAQEIDLPSWRQSIEAQLNYARSDSQIPEELRRHKLERVPNYDIEKDDPPEPSIVQHYLAVARA